MATGGTYTLLLDLAEPVTVTFGAAGERDLPAASYAYTGSAVGPGGFSRIDRHARVAAGEHDVRHWHVDWLLGHPKATLVEGVRSPGLEAECAVARAIVEAFRAIRGVGASDCGCDSHLAIAPNRDALGDGVREAHHRARRDDA